MCLTAQAESSVSIVVYDDILLKQKKQPKQKLWVFVEINWIHNCISSNTSKIWVSVCCMAYNVLYYSHSTAIQQVQTRAGKTNAECPAEFHGHNDSSWGVTFWLWKIELR